METRKSKRKDSEKGSEPPSASKRRNLDSSSAVPPGASPPSAGKRPARGRSERVAASSAATGRARGASGVDNQPPPPGGTSAEGARGARMDREPPNDLPGDGHEDEDDDLGAASFSRNLASASSALHGLLRKLGAGLDDIIPGASATHARLKGILVGLRAEGDDERQLESLNQLCEVLSISTEESLSAFSIESFVPILVGMLNYEHNPDMMLLAARALTTLVDVLPSSAAAVVHYGAVPCFCARLLTIEYIDLAEQSLQALEKLSHDHPGACLRAGGLMAVLSYLDFFATSVQRIAVGTAANLCRQLPSNAYELVVDTIPILTNLLQYGDHKIVEHACTCLTRLAEAFSGSAEKLDKLCSFGLIEHALSLTSLSENGASGATLSNATFYGFIQLLSTCAAGSPVVAEQLLQLGISHNIKAILQASSLVSNSPAMSPSTPLRSADQLFEILCLVNELMPAMPDALPAAAGVPPLAAGARSTPRRGPAKGAEDEAARAKILEESPGLVVRFSEDLFALLLQVYGVCVNTPVRVKCLSCIAKVLHFSSGDSLKELLKDLAVSSFISNVLAAKDPAVIGMGLLMSEILMEKLPDIFSKAFLKEGVVHAVDAVIAAVPSAGATTSGGGAKPPSGGRSTRSSRSSGDGATPASAAASSGAAGAGAGAGAATPATPNSTSMRATLSQRASRFKDKYFGDAAGGEGALATEGLMQLQSLCAALKGAKSPAEEDAAVKDLLATLSTSMDSISTFEFVGSGTVAFLKGYLTGADLLGADKDAVLARRMCAFVNVATPESATVGAGMPPPMQALVKKLQDALGSVERCPVLLSHAPRRTGEGGSAGSGSSGGLSALTQPFKLRLARAPAERTLRDYSTNIVLIEPLATLSAVEDFLWPRVRRAEQQAGAGAAGAAAGAAGGTGASRGDEAKPGEGEGKPTAGSPAGSARAGEASASGGTMTRAQAKAAAAAATSGEGASGSGGAERSKGKGKAADAAEKPAGKGAKSGGRGRRGEVEKEAEMMVEDDMMHGQEEEDEDDDELDDDEDIIGHDEDEDGMDYDDDEEEDELFGDALGGGGESVHDVQLGAEAGEAASGRADGGEGGSSASADAAPSTSRKAEDKKAKGAKSGADKGTKGAAEASKPEEPPAAPPSFPAAGAGAAAPPGGAGRRGYAAAAAAAAGPKLQFIMGGRDLPSGITIFQAIQQSIGDAEDDEEYDGAASRCLWDDVYTISYRKADDGPAPPAAAAAANSSVEEAAGALAAPDAAAAGPLKTILASAAPVSLDKSQAQAVDMLALLHVLETINRTGWRLLADTLTPARAAQQPPPLARVRREEFQSPKLTPKLARQLQDVLTLCSGGLPHWTKELMSKCPFLFPFECRRQYFYCTAFGLSRALLRLQQQQTAEGGAAASEGRELRVGRLQRQKVRVSRSRILDSATKVMELYAAHKAVLEVEYFGEVGTGLGPTLEFYTLVSHELQKSELGMWREEQRPLSGGGGGGGGGGDVDMEDGSAAEALMVGGDSADVCAKDAPVTREVTPGGLGVWGEMGQGKGDDFVYAPHGLFPRPLSAEQAVSSEGKKVVERFRLLGRVMAKALQDGRMMDLPLAPAFYRLALGLPLDLHDVRSFDPDLGANLAEMEATVRAGPGPGGKLQVRGCDVEDLCLDFTLPGAPEHALKAGGADEAVTSANLAEYVRLMVSATLGAGVRAQAEAFRAGFNQVFPLTSLRMFTEDEIEGMLCGCAEKWTVEGLTECIKFDHGYTAQSEPVRNLLRVLSELEPDDQRRFLRFATGAPRLPPGGVAALQPKLTVVRKQPTGGGGTTPGTSPANLPPGAGTELADNDLPSVMTCANYLKLPPFSCYEVTKERLLFAIREGQGSFDLS